jgi:hypothetical protein
MLTAGQFTKYEHGPTMARLMHRKKNPNAVKLGKLGGKKSAEALTSKQRSDKARKAAETRWYQEKKNSQS